VELPAEIYQVYPEARNFRNIYTSPASVKRAVARRKRYYRNVKVFKVYGVNLDTGELMWDDVTEDFIGNGS